VLKDIIEPSISINSPNLNDLFGTSAPDYDLTVTVANLDSIWYTLDGGITNSTLVSASGTVDQAMWNAVGNGTVTIRFYANDTLGNINYEELIVLKDIIEPSITINSPNLNDLFGTSAPDYDLIMVDSNLDSIWYTLDGGTTNSTLVSASGTVDQTMWNAIGNGTVTIRFYANDTVGNTAFSEIIVRKDIEDPIISIVTPTMNEVFEIPPAYEITITEVNLDKIWYSFDGGTNKIFITGLIGVIELTLWNQLPNGYVTIRFYANDTRGNISFDEVIIVKDTPTPSSPPGGIPGYNTLLLLGIISTISVIILKKRLNRLN
jgi:predicted pyridoxine 5'-phosphate oxidase superfamily flavin-nucleotide-binding protein